jgi:hypothetical protein
MFEELLSREPRRKEERRDDFVMLTQGSIYLNNAMW